MVNSLVICNEPDKIVYRTCNIDGRRLHKVYHTKEDRFYLMKTTETKIRKVRKATMVAGGFIEHNCENPRVKKSNK
jgi:hypothetical protein